jgi:hypothetical protein
MLFVRPTNGTLLFIFQMNALSGKNKKSKSRATPANKKTRPKKLPKAKLHNTSYRFASHTF